MSSDSIALVRVGYQDFAVEVDDLTAILNVLRTLKPVSNSYDTGTGYVHWYSTDSEITAKLVDRDSILSEKPPKPNAPAALVAPPGAAKTKDSRVMAPGGDPVHVAPVDVPRTKDFVDGYRDGE